MSNEVAIYEERPLTAADIRGQVNLIQEVMRTVMQEGQHYGKIPGAGDKPTLFKPGAEKIMATFALSADPEVEDLSGGDIIRFRVKCRLITKLGIFKGAGVGECSTGEEKYMWRSVVSEAEWNATPETHRRIKFKKDGQIRQIRTNPYDLANTVLKMAKKRALVDAVLTVTAASDCFTQDVEDMPEELFSKGNGSAPQNKPAPQPPQRKAPPSGNGSTIKDLDAPASEAQIKAIHAIFGKLGIEEPDREFEANCILNPEGKEGVSPVESLKELTKGQASTIIEALSKRQKETK